jgi:eukaryotic-like serine/threonine-protein kinase
MKKNNVLPFVLIIISMLLSGCSDIENLTANSSNKELTKTNNTDPSSTGSYKNTSNLIAPDIILNKSTTTPVGDIKMAIFVCLKNHIYALDKFSGKLYWSVEAKDQKDIYASREAINGMIFCTVSDGTIYALDAKSGNIAYTIKSDWSRHIVAQNGNSLFSLEGGEMLYETEITTGKEIWKYRPGGMLGVSKIINNVMFFSSNNEYFAALDLLSYKEKWRYHMENGEKTGMCVFSDSTVYIQTGSQTGASSIIALDIESGSRKWEFSGIKHCYGLAEADGVIYFGTYDGAIYAVDNNRGRLIWDKKVYGEIECPPTISKGIVYFGTRKSFLYAMNAKTGKIMWKTKDETGYRIYSSPKIIEGKLVYLKTNDENSGGETKEYLCGVDARTGNVIWKNEFHVLDFDSYICAENGTLFVSDIEGFIYAMDINTGNIHWKFPVST